VGTILRTQHRTENHPKKCKLNKNTLLLVYPIMQNLNEKITVRKKKRKKRERIELIPWRN